MKYNLISNRVGLFLKKVRQEKNLTGTQLAQLINVSQQQISRYETGASSMSLDQVNNILKVLDRRWIELIYHIDNVAENAKSIELKQNKLFIQDKRSK